MIVRIAGLRQVHASGNRVRAGGVRQRPGVFDHLEEHLERAGLRGPFLVISQPRIFKAVGQRLKNKYPVALISDGERAKTLVAAARAGLRLEADSCPKPGPSPSSGHGSCRHLLPRSVPR